MRAVAARKPYIRCVQRIGRRGLSTACIEGILSSAAPYVAVMDGDLQHDETLLPRMLEQIKAERLDVVVASRHVAEGRLEDPLYLSPMGPIAPLDVLYGHRASLARGNAFMAHRTGFTGNTLGAALIGAKFAAVMVQRSPDLFCLDAIAFHGSVEA